MKMPRTSLLRSVLVLACVALQASPGAAPLALSLALALHEHEHSHAIQVVHDTGHRDIVLSHRAGLGHGDDDATAPRAGDSERPDRPGDGAAYDARPSLAGAPAESDHVLHAIDATELATRGASWTWAAPSVATVAWSPARDVAPRVVVRPPTDLRVGALDPLRTVVLRL